MSSEVLFRSAAVVLFYLQLHVLHLPFSYSIPELIIRSDRTFDNFDADDNYNDYDEEYCSDLKKPENGLWEGSCKHATQGESCTFHCRDGYVLQGAEKLFCTDNLKWSAVTPKCRHRKKEPKHCPAIKIDNAILHGFCNAKTEEGEMCKIECEDGYKLEGDAKFTCTKDDETKPLIWKPVNAARCVKESEFCPTLQRPENTIWDETCDEAKSGYSCDLECHEGYRLEGKDKLICSTSLQWDGSPPICVKDGLCPELKKPENAIWNGECRKATPGEECTFTCEEGYTLKGSGAIFCRKNFKWNKKPPSCVKNDGTKPNGFDCSDIKRNHPESRDGVYTINPPALNKSIQVFCDMTSDDGGWTVFQRRNQNKQKENFYRTWDDYKTGFGNLSGEFWLGNDYIHALTENEPQMLRVDLENFDSSKRFAKYHEFAIANEENDYKLSVLTYRGDAGDSLLLHKGCTFSTKDRGVHSLTTAARKFKGAWWYLNIYTTYSNLNGLNLRGKQPTFGDGIIWFSWLGYYYSLKKTEMKIKPRVPIRRNVKLYRKL